MARGIKLSIGGRIEKKELEYRNTERKLKSIKDELRELYAEKDLEDVKELQEILKKVGKTPADVLAMLQEDK